MNDVEFYESALDRIRKATLAIGAVGLVAATSWRGWTWGAGFALGAGVSWLNFRWLKGIVEALGSTQPTRMRVAVLAGLRYALLGGGAYAILHYSPISLTAAMAGLFVAVAAVIAEICFELVYAARD